jgi:hypothetical protein
LALKVKGGPGPSSPLLPYQEEGKYMPRERRSLWRSISTSKKVNRISLKAALLYTWAIPHFDDEGYMEGDPETLKVKIVPFRREFSIREVKKLTHELKNQGLWEIFEVSDATYIRDPVFNDYQTFKGIHKIPSKIRPLIKQEKISTTPDGVYDDTDKGEQVKRSEVKLREEKLSKGETPFSSSKDETPPGYERIRPGQPQGEALVKDYDGRLIPLREMLSK